MKTGKLLLLIAGICYILEAIWTAINVALTVINSEELAAAIGVIIVGILSFCFYFFAGHAGWKVWKTGERKYVKRAFIFAVILLILSVIGIIMSHAVGDILALVITVLYVIGAFMVKSAAKK